MIRFEPGLDLTGLEINSGSGKNPDAGSSGSKSGIGFRPRADQPAWK
jgi:hypothetical protein